jgi:hypothetical protein
MHTASIEAFADILLIMKLKLFLFIRQAELGKYDMDSKIFKTLDFVFAYYGSVRNSFLHKFECSS